MEKSIWFKVLGFCFSLAISTPFAHADKTELKPITHGLRQKKVLFANFDVYTLKIFSSAKVDFKALQKTEDSEGLPAAMTQFKSALEKALPLTITMTFLRDIDIEKIVEGFEDVFNENGIDKTQAPFSEYLKAIATLKEVKDQQVFTFTFQKSGSQEKFRLETNGKEVFAIQNGAKGTVSKFLNMWLGKPVSGLENLQEQLLKPEEND